MILLLDTGLLGQLCHPATAQYSDAALDGDVILAAQAILVSGTVITSNRKHLSQFVPTKDWSELAG
jgi:hypothetical protein